MRHSPATTPLFAFTLAIAAAATTTARAQFTSSGIDLLAWLPGAAEDNDCWGYVSPSGREYAILGLVNATAFIEITDPKNPVVVKSFPHSFSTTGDMKTYKQYAYSCGDDYSLQIFDLASIDSGIVTQVATTSLEAHNIALNEASGHLYSCAANVGSGIAAFDLSNPTAPVQVGYWKGAGHVHDAQIVTYDSGPYAGKEIAFCFSGYDDIDILDVTNKGAIQLLAHVSYPSQQYTHQGWLSEDRKYLYVNDELDELWAGIPTTRTLVFDVQNLSSPQYLGNFTTGSPATDHNLFVKGDLLYEANYTSGVWVFDIGADPLNPPIVGYFDTYPEHNNVGYGEGAWGVFPFFPSGTFVASDVNRGLFVLELTTTCYPDCDQSGSLDLFDFLCFVNEFNSGNTYADCDGSGSLDLFDFLCFVNEFNTGCP